METYMKKIKLMCVALILLGSIPASPAWARGGHHGGGGPHHGGGHHRGYGGYGLALGLGVLGGYGLGYYGNRMPYYPPAYGYAPGYGYGGYGGYAGYAGYAPNYGYAPVVAVPAVPPVYIQQQEIVQVPPQASAANYWHYCRNPEGYYPYVKNCPDGWMQVAPQPSAQ